MGSKDMPSKMNNNSIVATNEDSTYPLAELTANGSKTTLYEDSLAQTPDTSPTTYHTENVTHNTQPITRHEVPSLPTKRRLLVSRTSIDSTNLDMSQFRKKGSGDSMSLASKRSHTSRFMRTMSFRKSRAASWLSAKLRKHQKGTDLSAAFNLLDQENKGMLVDLNCATEEELMTVSGITRFIARSIVEYRAAIGGFKQLQDLALVSGVGAARMATLCQDLTIKESYEPSDGCSSSEESAPPPHPTSLASAPTPSPRNSHLPSPQPFMSQPPSHMSPCPSTSHLTTPAPPHPLHHQLLSTASSSCCTSPSHHPPSPLRRVNINTASIFELMTAPGINQEMAANIVHYREKKGKFRSVDEVCRVRGMRPKLTRHLHPHLMVTNTASPAPSSSAASPSVKDKSITTQVINLHKNRLKGHRRTLSAPSTNAMLARLGSLNLENGKDTSTVNFEEAFKEKFVDGYTAKDAEYSTKMGHRLSMEFSSDVYELLSLRSERPEIGCLFENCHLGRSAVRVATWNLCHLTPDKLSNPGVMEVLCRTILERGFTVLAVQDVLGRGLLSKISTELNTGSLRRVREWPGKRGTWAFVESTTPVGYYTLFTQPKKKCYEYSGFLYNKKYVKLMNDEVLDLKTNYVNVCKPYIAQFVSNSLNFTVANLHIKEQVKIYRSKSFLQSSSNLEDILTETCPRSPGDAPDTLKGNKNFQNGLIKENILGREDLSRGGVRTSSRSEGAEEDVRKGVLLSEGGEAEEDVHEMMRQVSEACGGEAATLLLGHGLSSASRGLARLGYTSVQTPPEEEESAPPAEDIFLSAGAAHMYTGVESVVGEGLSHLAIPRGWGWGGLATPNCPRYADVFTSAS